MQHTHHLVIFVREDMAMPDIASGLVECRLDLRDLAGQCRDHIFRRFFQVSISSSKLDLAGLGDHDVLALDVAVNDAVFVCGLERIRHVGERISEVLAHNFGSIDALRDATEEDLLAVDEVGPEVAQSIHGFFARPQNIEVLDRLRAAGRVDHARFRRLIYNLIGQGHVFRRSIPSPLLEWIEFIRIVLRTLPSGGLLSWS